MAGKKAEVISTEVAKEAITKKEIIELGVVMREEQLEKELAEAEAVLKAAKEAKDKKKEEFSKVLDVHREAYSEDVSKHKKVKEALAAIKTFTGKEGEIGEPHIYWWSYDRDSVDGYKDTTVVQYDDKAKPNMCAWIDTSVLARKHYHRYKKALKTLEEEVEKLSGEVKEKEEAVKVVKAALKDLPKQERRMRAYLTKASLSNDPEAAKLVEELRGIGVKGLPRLVDKKKS